MLRWQPKATTACVYLKYAQAEELVDVLERCIRQPTSKRSARRTESDKFKNNEVMISAHKGTNSLVITAPQDIMNAMLDVIAN